MPLTTRPYFLLSDLVIHERDPSVGYARECVFVDTSADTVVTPGTVAFRAKAATDTAYTLLSDPAQLVATNEFIVLFGNEYGAQDSWTILAADVNDRPLVGNCVGFVRDNVVLSDHYLKQIYTTGGSPVLTATQFEALRHLLKEQGVIVEVAY